MLFPSRLGRTPATRLRREKAVRRSAETQLDQLRIRRRLAHELNERKAAIPGILDALVVKAQEGDVPAARELRGWRGVDERTYADMTPEERARSRAALIKRIAEAEAALEEGEAQAGWPRTGHGSRKSA